MDQRRAVATHSALAHAVLTSAAFTSAALTSAVLTATALLLVVGAAPVGALATNPPAAPDSVLAFAQIQGVSANPCERLAAGEVKFDVGQANRVTFATARAYGFSEVLITGCVSDGDAGYQQEWQVTGFAGRTGFAPAGQMWENTLFSPTGSFTVTEALGREDPGTALKYYRLNEASRWGGERGPTYNQYFEGDGGSADENLWQYMKSGLYEQAAVINWNRPPDMPVTQGASFAIFLHAGNAETWGCISTDLATVTAFLRTAVPGDRMVMGIQQDIFVNSTARSEAAAAEAVERAAKERAEAERAEAAKVAAEENAAAAKRAAEERAAEERAAAPTTATAPTTAVDGAADSPEAPRWAPYALLSLALGLASVYVILKKRANRAVEDKKRPKITQ